MISSVFSALSIIRALGQKLGVTANNIANMNTDGFEKSCALLQEGSNVRRDSQCTYLRFF